MTDKKRLIDADAFAGCLERMTKTAYPNLFPGLLEAIDFVKDFPTVDAVEVVHGEWIVCGDGEYVPFMCSACGKTTSWYHAQTANYCPNCGAKMDQEES